MTAEFTTSDLHTDELGFTRCRWCISDPLYVTYHDTEWGFPQTDDHRLFEKICLEGFQAGLSWLTILRKRDRFREVFHGFDPQRMARMTKRDVDRLMKDTGIIRHRGKIESAINNAQRCLELLEEFDAIWEYASGFACHSPESPIRGLRGKDNLALPRTMSDVPAKTDASIALSKNMRQRGWSFVGPTTIYAFMQAVGLVNDHLDGCEVRAACNTAHMKLAATRATAR